MRNPGVIVADGLMRKHGRLSRWAVQLWARVQGIARLHSKALRSSGSNESVHAPQIHGFPGELVV